VKPGQASQTAVLVAMGRAAAHGRTSATAFSDPTALLLLPPEARARVERYRSAKQPQGFRDRIFEHRIKMMVVRTVAIDEAVRGVTSPQVVILGAGLDGRAWRMPELANSVVFEVDHPDTQREKRARIAPLTQTAREVRFVAVDFTRDHLDDALVKAGHDASQPTTWIWEGVVMYLSRAEVERTLAVIERLSAPHSRLVIAYHSPALMLLLVGAAVRALGEPLRSVFTADTMRSLLAKYGFVVVRDEDMPTIARALPPDIGQTIRRIKHARIVVADRR
jgi:methyltransferase (TIGR00027 family)